MTFVSILRIHLCISHYFGNRFWSSISKVVVEFIAFIGLRIITKYLNKVVILTTIIYGFKLILTKFIKIVYFVLHICISERCKTLSLFSLTRWQSGFTSRLSLPITARLLLCINFSFMFRFIWVLGCKSWWFHMAKSWLFAVIIFIWRRTQSIFISPWLIAYVTKF